MDRSLADLVALLDGMYDPSWAEPWDAVGLVAGDPEAPVRRVLLAVDCTDEVAEEAIAWGADLIVAHHPLFLRPVSGLAAVSPKGRRMVRLIRNDVALFTAHTNADRADPGVSDALAGALGAQDLRPLEPSPADPLDKIVAFVPGAQANAVLDAMAAAGAGAIGNYFRCAWTASGEGTFLPGPGARPSIGEPGRIERVAEHRVEMVLPRHRRRAVVAAMRAAHPYEEPAYDVIELAALPGRRGLGRVGRLPSAETFGRFVERVARCLPATPVGVRAAGDPDRAVRTVAVCGGAGDSLLATAARAQADVFVTADLRHHPAAEALEQGGPMLVDPGHWASEWPWLLDAERRLVAAVEKSGATVETRVSRIVTDPWTTHARAIDAPPDMNGSLH